MRIRLTQCGSEGMSWASVETLQGERGCNLHKGDLSGSLQQWVEPYPEAMIPPSWKLHSCVFDKALSEIWYGVETDMNDSGLT